MHAGLSNEWDKAITDLYLAARDSAEFAAGVPTGRSRTVSLRRLAAAVEAVEQLERDCDRNHFPALPINNTPPQPQARAAAPRTPGQRVLDALCTPAADTRTWTQRIDQRP